MEARPVDQCLHRDRKSGSQCLTLCDDHLKATCCQLTQLHLHNWNGSDNARFVTANPFRFGPHILERKRGLQMREQVNIWAIPRRRKAYEHPKVWQGGASSTGADGLLPQSLVRTTGTPQ
eukprot:1398237-Amphidinium_carterae.1